MTKLKCEWLKREDAEERESISKAVYFWRTPSFFQLLFPDITWRLPGKNEVYLTFDDGPSSCTEELLQVLQDQNCQASFFLSGRSLSTSRIKVENITQDGHVLGHHGYDHLNGWKTDDATYFKDVIRCAEHIPSHYFRPPYGKMKRSQYKWLKKRYRIVLWDIMPGDFDHKVSSTSLLKRVLSSVQDGSIIALHDDDRSNDKLLDVLPEMIQGIRKKGLSIESPSIHLIATRLVNNQVP